MHNVQPKWTAEFTKQSNDIDIAAYSVYTEQTESSSLNNCGGHTSHSEPTNHSRFPTCRHCSYYRPYR